MPQQEQVHGAMETEAHGAIVTTTGDRTATRETAGEMNNAHAIASGIIETTTTVTEARTDATSTIVIGATATTTASEDDTRGRDHGHLGAIGGETMRTGRIGGGRGNGLWTMGEMRSGDALTRQSCRILFYVCIAGEWCISIILCSCLCDLVQHSPTVCKRARSHGMVTYR